MPKHSSLLKFEGLRCERDDRLLFRDLSGACDRGDLLRVAGPNGAGKTTLLRILAGLFEADEGQVWVDHSPHYEMRENMLYFGHRSQVSRDLSVMENLEFLTGADRPTLQAALRSVGLHRYHDSLVRELSQGQGRRCALARLWCTHAPIWILDEPYAALDVQMVSVLDTKINDHLAAGGVCVFTTHQPPHSLQFETLELGHVD